MLSGILVKNDKGDYEQLRPSAQKENLEMSYGFTRPFPKDKGRGGITSFSITRDLSVGISNCRLNQDYRALFALKNPMFSLGFCIRGHSCFTNLCNPEPVAMTPGRSYVHFFEGCDYERKIKGQDDLLSLGILVSPDFLIKLLDPDHHQDVHSLKAIEDIMDSRHFFSDNGMSSQMKTTFFQILNNPHQGKIGRIYLESKALELIALVLDQACRPMRSSTKNRSLTTKEKERIYQARDLLIKSLQFPPSLRDLAKQVGISHSRLTNGFKTIFGFTVFEYLRKERLSYARMLIEEKTIDLTSVAFESGFCSSSHFAASFQKEYGIRPSEYRKL